MADDVVEIDFPQAVLPETSSSPGSAEPPAVSYGGSVVIDYSQVQGTPTDASTFYKITGSLTLDGQQATSYQVQGFGGGSFLLDASFPGSTEEFPSSSEGVVLDVFYGGEQPTTVSASASATYRVRGGYDDETEYGDPNPEPVTAFAVCFTAGTSIALADGAAAIETLAVGDFVLTSAGALRPIRWLGRRRVDCRRHPSPRDVMPVRIRAHAFADNCPARDLLVSPGHAVCVEGPGEMLIPAGALVNGATVVQEHVDAVAYWHVELESHDVILAENLPCESYLEMGNRSFFAGGGVVALAGSPDAAGSTHAAPSQGPACQSGFCRPYHAVGELVDAVRARLVARAHRLGWRLEERGLSGLHLIVDGARVEPVTHGLTVRFDLPAGARDVWLVSATGVPADIGDGTDRRTLGVAIAALSIDDSFGPSRAVRADDPRLTDGFHDVERCGPAVFRWMADRAMLPTEVWAGSDGNVTLTMELARPALPHWAASGISASASTRLFA